MKFILKLMLFVVFVFNKGFSQSFSFKGNASYVKEGLLLSGNYKEKTKVTVYYNEKGYVYLNDLNIDTNKIVNNNMAFIKKQFENDSFELEKFRKKTLEKIKLQIAEKLNNNNNTTFINFDSRSSVKNRQVSKKDYCVTDSVARVMWTLNSDTMTIENLLCQKATGLFNGKLFTVWFAPSIPFAAGPLNMHGLPGIIVLATSEDKQVRYRLTNLNYPLLKPVEFYICNSKNKISGMEFAKIQAENQANFKAQHNLLKSNEHKKDN